MIFSATRRRNIVATLFRMVTTLFQHCNAVALKIVKCETASRPAGNITLKLPETLHSYTFYGGNVVRVLVHLFFFHCRSFSPWWQLAFLNFPPPLENFHAVLPAKKSLLCLLFLALFLVELRWPVAYFLFFSVSLFLCIPNLCTWQLL